MCGTLTLTCQRIGEFNTRFTDHYLIHPDYRIPCKQLGSQACKAGEAELVNFQSPPTGCAGAERGYHPESEQCREVCRKGLERYGAALYRMNTAGPTRKSAWYAWLRSWVIAERMAREAAPLLRD